MKQFNNLTIGATHFESLYPATSREKEIGQILTCIKSGNFSQVISLPGGGASLLLGLLSYNQSLREKHLGKEEKDYHFVFCNFLEVRNKPLNEVLRFLFLSLIDSLPSRHAGSPSLKLRRKRGRVQHLQRILESQASPGPQNDAVMFNSLKKAIEKLTLEKNMKIVFLFDRFEDYLPRLETEFFANLRTLRRDALYKFSVVFAVNRPLEQLLDPEIIADIYEFIADHTTYLNIYDKPTLDFRISEIEKAFGEKIEKKLLDKIIGLTAGHINLTRLCVETVLESNVNLSSFWGVPPKAGRLQNLLPQQPSVQRDSGRASLARMTVESDSNLAEFFLSHKSIQSGLLDIWKSLTPSEQNSLSNLTMKQFNNETISTHLTNIGLLKNGTLTIKLLKYFLKQNPSLQTAQEHIGFEEKTKEIKKGNLSISDKLSSFEYNLLRFFLQNPNRIIERDEVINNVWGDKGSTLGISDEALDQLVFRARRKIENDPNNPIHLQTIKGRGFRFIP